MKKFLFIFFVLVCFSLTSAYAKQNPYDAIYNVYQVVYSPSENKWSAGGVGDGNKIVLTKKNTDTMSIRSVYYYPNETKAIELSSDFELIKNGILIGIDNANLKYYKVEFTGDGFIEVPLTFFELQETFPEATIARLSYLSKDGKMWVSKKLFKKKTILFLNDSEEFYYKLTPRAKKIQNKEIKGLITFNRYGIFNFDHFGQRDGKLIVYVR